MNRARPMAARLKKKIKPRVDYEPRSAHGRAVNKEISEPSLTNGTLGTSLIRVTWITFCENFVPAVRISFPRHTIIYIRMMY